MMTTFNLGDLSNNSNYHYNPFTSTHRPYQPAIISGMLTLDTNPADIHRFRITPEAFSPNLIHIYSDLPPDGHATLSLWQDKTMNAILDTGDQPLATGAVGCGCAEPLNGLCISEYQLRSVSDYFVVVSISSGTLPYRLMISDHQLSAIWNHFLKV